MKVKGCVILWSIVLFKTHGCLNITNYHGHGDFKSGSLPPVKKLWTTYLPNPPFKLRCLAISVLDEKRDGFFYDSDSGRCTGVDTRTERLNSLGHQTPQSPLLTDTAKTVFYRIMRQMKGTGTTAPTRTTLRLFVHTGTVDNASAKQERIKVTIMLKGKNGTFVRELKHATNTDTPFCLGCNDTYEFTSANIGEIVAARIKGESLGMGDSWFLDKIIIEKRVKYPGHHVSVDVYSAELGDRVTKHKSVFNIFRSADEKPLRLQKMKQYTEQQ